jgi:hypothetical protein
MKPALKTLTLTAALLAAAAAAHAQRPWFNDPYTGMAVVTNETGRDEFPQVVRLSSGRSLVIWVRYDEIKLKYRVISQEGLPLPSLNGNYLFTGIWNYGTHNFLLPDSNGGAMCIVRDCRDGHYNVYGQKFNSLGSPQWGDNGLPLVVWPGSEDAILWDVAWDSVDTYFITWVPDLTSGGDVYVQKINTAGDRLWGDYGMPACTAPGIQSWSHVVPDGGGGGLVVWENDGSSFFYQHLGGRLRRQR